MKKILFTLLMLCGMTAAWAGTDDSPNYEAEGFITVTTADDLKSVIQKDNAAKVLLGADIDVSNIGKICETFRGTIVGEYTKVDEELNAIVTLPHMLTGKYTEEHTGSPLTDYLFDNVEGATFESIIFANFMVHANDDNVGVIAKTANNSHFKNLVFARCSLFNNDDGVGVAVGSATSCVFEYVMAQNCDVTTDAEYAGAIVGISENCKFTGVSCGTTVYVFADGNVSNAYSGGIVGRSKSDNFTHCSHMGLVGANSDYVGGMTGYSEGSNFVLCTNCATVATCKGSTFTDIQKQREEELKKLDETTLTSILGSLTTGTLSTAATGALITRISFLCHRAHLAKLARLAIRVTPLDGEVAAGAWEAEPIAEFIGGPVLGYFAVAVMVGLTAWYIYYDATGDDYAGGIVGCATGGTIEQCTNYGLVNAIDQYIGGIAGSADNVKINNCLNDAIVNQERDNFFTDNTYGGIIGIGIKNTKITNCLTNNSYHISGARANNYRLDQSSGNNFCVGQTQHDPEREFLEMSISQDLVENGLVAFWLNNGVENREKGIKPWHQNLWRRYNHGQIVNRDLCPTLDEKHDEVNADLFYDNIDNDPEHVYIINTAAQLQKFAEDVNNGKQFVMGYLDSDIDMTGQDWTPIGKNSDKKHFRGIFNGRGHKITGLTCSSPDQPVGLFGAVHTGAEICNVTIGEGSSFTCEGIAGAGGIVGTVHMGTSWGNVVIENCGSLADINVSRHGGGILGHVDVPDGNTTIKVYVDNCYSMGTITAKDCNSALLCGYTKDNGYVSNSWSTGKLLSSTEGKKPYDESHHEYFVGYHEKVSIKDCFALEPSNNVQHASSDLTQNGVENLSAASVANGEFANNFNKNYGQQVLQQNLGTDPTPVPGDRGFYHTRKIKNQYGTVCFPFPVKSDEKISYYKCADQESEVDGVRKLKFEYISYVPTCTPVLFYAPEVNDKASDESPVEICINHAGNEFDLDLFTAPSAHFHKWHLEGTFGTKVFEGEDAAKVYYISDNQIHNAQKATIAPYRAYIVGPKISELKAAGVKAIQIEIEDEDGMTTALDLVGEDLVPVQQNGKSYSVMGTEVGDSYRGIVIRNGKKVLRK